MDGWQANKGRRKRSAMATCVAVWLLCAPLPAPGQSVSQDTSTQPATCTLDQGPRGHVVGVDDSETLRLADGQKVRLLGTLGPRPPLTTPEGGAWPPEREAHQALRQLVTGRDVTLAFDGRRRDRYGRYLAHVFVWHNGSRLWVQGEMLAHGHGRAYVSPGNTACIDELLAHESLARRSARGLWGHRRYRILRPEPARWLTTKRRHRFELVAGVVRDVAIVKSRVYLNFGNDWRRDFTAAIDKRALPDAKQGLDSLSALKGRRVRVRGWIERRNGPYIKLADVRLIERLDVPTDDGPSRQTAPPALASSDTGSLPHWLKKLQLKAPHLRQRNKKRPAQ